VTHFLALLLYSLLVATVFAALSSEHPTPRQKIRYAAKVFAYFVVLGLAIAWILYPLPF
jgi:uncharacterized membrane protein YozB (DUF420 family)